MHQPKDKHSRPVAIGARIRLLELSDRFLESLPADELEDVRSMFGMIFEVEEIDEYGQPWISKSWPNEREGTCHSHSIALESNEMELVDDKAL